LSASLRRIALGRARSFNSRTAVYEVRSTPVGVTECLRKGASVALNGNMEIFSYAGRLCVTCYVAQGPEEAGTQTSTAVGLRAIPYLAFGRGVTLTHKSSVHFTYSGRRAIKN